jgi:hypothetical protein
MNYNQYVKEYGLEEGKRRWTAHTTGKRKTSGFAAMTKEQGKKIQSMGGKALHEKVRLYNESQNNNSAS